MKIPAALTLFVGLSSFATGALAEEPKKDGHNYAYEFPDDKLLTSDGSGITPFIKVRKQGARDILQRPRLQFVTELLKSVENM